MVGYRGERGDRKVTTAALFLAGWRSSLSGFFVGPFCSVKGSCVNYKDQKISLSTSEGKLCKGKLCEVYVERHHTFLYLCERQIVNIWGSTTGYVFLPDAPLG